MRDLIIQVVLGTDMRQHFGTVSLFNGKVEAALEAQAAATATEAATEAAAAVISRFEGVLDGRGAAAAAEAGDEAEAMSFVLPAVAAAAGTASAAGSQGSSTKRSGSSSNSSQARSSARRQRLAVVPAVAAVVGGSDAPAPINDGLLGSSDAMAPVSQHRSQQQQKSSSLGSGGRNPRALETVATHSTPLVLPAGAADKLSEFLPRRSSLGVPLGSASAAMRDSDDLLLHDESAFYWLHQHQQQLQQRLQQQLQQQLGAHELLITSRGLARASSRTSAMLPLLPALGGDRSSDGFRHSMPLTLASPGQVGFKFQGLWLARLGSVRVHLAKGKVLSVYSVG